MQLEGGRGHWQQGWEFWSHLVAKQPTVDTWRCPPPSIAQWSLPSVVLRSKGHSEHRVPKHDCEDKTTCLSEDHDSGFV